MVENICFRCAMSSSKWWNNSPSTRHVYVMIWMLLSLPLCLGLEESPQTDSSISFYWAEVNLTYIDPNTNKQVYKTSKGKYGTSSLIEQRSGLVVHVRTRDNKTHGCSDYGIKLPKEKWIALVERGECYFTDKIRKATKTYNASAVVIYNNDAGMTIMQHTVDDQVSIFVSQETGKLLAKLADQGVRVMITITPGRMEETGLNSANSISKTSVLFVSISFIVLMIISLAWLVFYYIQRFRYAHAKERLARRLASAAKKAIAKIPQKSVKNGDKELDSDFDQCAVCIESYKPHDVIRTLPCKHVFHKSCVDPWLLDQRSCPMCKLDILRAYGMQVFGSQESVHQDPESGNVPVPVEDREPSSATDDQATVDTEVKILLLPHTCLHHHHHHGHDPTPNSSVAAGIPSQVECHTLSCATSVKNSSSAECLSQASSAQDTETQALMSNQCDEDEEDDEGLDEHHPCPYQGGGRNSQDLCMNLPEEVMKLMVRLPEQKV